MKRSHRIFVFCKSFCPGLLAVGLGAAVLAAAGQSGDPSQWNSDDVYRILHNSPWTRTAKLSRADRDSSDMLNGPNSGAGSAPNNPNMGQMPGRMGRRSAGGGTYSNGSGNRSSTKGPVSQATDVTIQWQSALPVRLAAAKDAGKAVDAATLKPGDYYIVALVGLPLEDVGGRAASADSEATTDEGQAERIEQVLKSATSLVRSGHEPLTPVKIELDQGRDGRILFYFAKTDPIVPKDKTVEFRLAAPHAGVRKKFTLKEMEYQGQLQL